MITKYRTRTFGTKPIVEVQVERETNASVWIDGNRRAKRSEYDNYFDSWVDAKKHLLERAERKLKGARRSLHLAQSEYGNIKGLKAP